MVHPPWRTPAATCLAENRTDDRPTQGTLNILKTFTSNMPGTADSPPTEAGMGQCNALCTAGVLYRAVKKRCAPTLGSWRLPARRSRFRSRWDDCREVG
ncbi:hypothetical protein ON010_g14621 [Phytophthora cinnamomi]|nr:hypothetical protein ON010_g14621 [Phytophthora cinnamomi]